VFRAIKQGVCLGEFCMGLWLPPTPESILSRFVNMTFEANFSMRMTASVATQEDQVTFRGMPLENA
jgi:hypothetical protein